MTTEVNKYQNSDVLLGSVARGLADIHNQCIATYSGRMEVTSSKMKDLIDQHQDLYLQKLASVGMLTYKEESVTRT